jgi:hypothetical protein
MKEIWKRKGRIEEERGGGWEKMLIFEIVFLCL